MHVWLTGSPAVAVQQNTVSPERLSSKGSQLPKPQFLTRFAEDTDCTPLLLAGVGTDRAPKFIGDKTSSIDAFVAFRDSKMGCSAANA